MILFEQFDRKADAIRRIGDDVRADARISSTPISYTEPAYRTDVSREYPCGRRDRVSAGGLVAALPPRGH
jgi:hypothetical protein